MRPSVAKELLKRLKPGRVYRTHELRAFSKNLSRDLERLCKQGKVVQAAAGLYYKPKMSRFGPLPAPQDELIRAFLGNDDFLSMSLSDYNPLGVGLTQMYNEVVVYNHKRHGKFVLDGRNYSFRMRPDFPTALSKEFLLVDVLNNRRELAEDTTRLEHLLAERAKEVGRESLLEAAQRYGKVATKRFFERLGQ